MKSRTHLSALAWFAKLGVSGAIVSPVKHLGPRRPQFRRTRGSAAEQARRIEAAVAKRIRKGARTR